MAASSEPASCVIVPPGLQALLMYAGLLRHLAERSPVLLCTQREHLSTIRRIFGDVDMRFWFDKDTPEASARAMGMDVMVVPDSPVRAYASVGLVPVDMHRLFFAERSDRREDAVLQAAKDAVGPTFVVTQGDISPALLPEGVPTVDIDTVDVEEPFDLCGILVHAAQVHAVDGWVLTLADLVGGGSRKFCHAYASQSSVEACRKKYRKRVGIVARRPLSVAA